jgi:putative peptide zinc metalloprotease protein
MQNALSRSVLPLRSLVGAVARKLPAAARDRRSERLTFRPRRSDNVRLVGPMNESAFATQPWLIERNGKFIQVTELLYRIAELSDGTHSIDQLASLASDALRSHVSPDLVWRMLETRLVPIGIIAAQPPLQAPSASSNGSIAAARSPLALNMRMAVVRPGLIDALTHVLQYLYAPPVLVLLLFVIVQAQYWLLFVHGVAGGVSQTLNTPGGAPVVFGLVMASTAFHEFGHAAALRYGGGRVRGMGVGFYLVYPAFYTDVTDNYRLGRWARVRTDLGGFYFNLLFSLGLMGAYHLTGQELLLVPALLTDIEIIHQCLPFVRLDGYWALADLTGIPDFFSFMGAYLRSVVPVPGWKGRKLPRLKWWATAVFGAYIAITIPVIALLLFATVRNAPRILMTACSAVQLKLAELAQAQATGDVVGAATAEAQILLLLLPVFGLALFLFAIARRLTVGLWRWGKPTRGRRFASAFAAAAVAALLVFMWLPGVGDPTTYARILDLVASPRWASAATPITSTDGGTVQQAVAAMPQIVPPTPEQPHNELPPTAAPVAHPTTAPPPPTTPVQSIQSTPTAGLSTTNSVAVIVTPAAPPPPRPTQVSRPASTASTRAVVVVPASPTTADEPTPPIEATPTSTTAAGRSSSPTSAPAQIRTPTTVPARASTPSVQPVLRRAPAASVVPSPAH